MEQQPLPYSKGIILARKQVSRKQRSHRCSLCISYPIVSILGVENGLMSSFAPQGCLIKVAGYSVETDALDRCASEWPSPLVLWNRSGARSDVSWVGLR